MDPLDWRRGTILKSDDDLDVHKQGLEGASREAVDPGRTDAKVGEIYRDQALNNGTLKGSPTAAEAAFMCRLGWRADGEHKYPEMRAAPPKGRLPFPVRGGSHVEDPEETDASQLFVVTDQKKTKKKRRKGRRKSPAQKQTASSGSAAASPLKQRAGGLCSEGLDSKAGAVRGIEVDREKKLRQLLKEAKSRAKTRQIQESEYCASYHNGGRILPVLDSFTTDEADEAFGRFNVACQELLGRFKGKQEVTVEFEKKMMDCLISAQVKKFKTDLRAFYIKTAIILGLTSAERRIIEGSNWVEDQAGIFKQGLKTQVELGRLKECSQRKKKQTCYDFLGEMRPEAISMMVMAQKIAYSRYIHQLTFLSEARLEMYLQKKFSTLHLIIKESNIKDLFAFVTEVLEFDPEVVKTVRESLVDLAFEEEGTVAKVQVNFVLALLDGKIQELLTESSSNGVEYICKGCMCHIGTESQSDDDGYNDID